VTAHFTAHVWRSGTAWACAGTVLAFGACGGGGPSESTGSTSTPPPVTPSSGLWASGYYPAYATGVMPISAIPFDSMTHVIHFALVPNTDGTLADPDGLRSQSSALVTAAHGAGVKALLGVGGDTSAGAPRGFRLSTTAAHRAAFVTNVVAETAAAGYDGVDINWESLEFPGDVANFRAFVTELRSALDQHAPPTHFLLTYPAGTSSGFEDYVNNANLVAPVQALFDQINLQTYVMAGPFPGWVTWHNSALFAGTCRFSTGAAPPSIDSTVAPFAAAGIPKRKLGIGIQLVGVDWVGGSGTDTGGVSKPCQSWDYSRVKPDGSDQDIGAPSYNAGWNFVNAADMARNYTAANGYTASSDSAAMVPFLSKDQAGSAGDHFVSYENAQSIQAKGDYLKAQGLGGTIVFEITQDYLSDQPVGDAQHPLMTAVRQSILR
jgi:chitinase